MMKRCVTQLLETTDGLETNLRTSAASGCVKAFHDSMTILPSLLEKQLTNSV